MANPSNPLPWIEPIIDPLPDVSLSTFKPHYAGTTAPPLDKSNGRVYKIDGNIYYSPNCSRDGIREPTFYASSSALVRDPYVDKVKEFMKPFTWCSSRTTYLVFMPTFLDMYSPPLTALGRNLPIRRSSRGFFLDAEQVLSMTRTEFELLNIIEDIAEFFQVHDTGPVVPTALSFEMFFESRKLAQNAVERSRDWFAVWVGLMAYHVAIAEITTKDDQRPDEPPTWWRVLSRKGSHSPDMISSLRMTALGGFHNCDRVGTFLDVLDPPARQPSVDFFHHFKVPVFYAWGTAEAVMGLKNPELGRLAPLPEQLQAVASYLIIEPSLSGDFMEPWLKHKERVKERRLKRIKTETEKQRSIRLNREANPRTSKVPIYVWQNLVGILVCCPSDEDSVLGYGENQRVYNSIDNEWDCSTYFGELGEDEAAAMEEVDIMVAEPSCVGFDMQESLYRNLGKGLDDLHREMGLDVPLGGKGSVNVEVGTSVGPSSKVAGGRKFITPPSVIPKGAMRPSSSLIRTTGWSCPTNSGTFIADKYGQYQLHEFEMVDLLLRFAGFRVPLRFPSSIMVSPRSSFDSMTRDLGSLGDESFFQSPVGTLALDFWNDICNASPPNAAFWDLSAVNQKLRESARLRLFRSLEVPTIGRELEPSDVFPELKKPKKPRETTGPRPPPPATHETMFILDFGSFSTVPWRFAVFGVVEMLMVCRFPPDVSEQDILQDFVSRGITCQTLLPVNSLPIQLPPPLASVPLRLSGHMFTEADYRAYEDHARALLLNPHIARAALLAGGILWRVALKFSASISLVTNGPVRQEASFSYPAANGCYVHDGLHLEEANVLCGLYYIYKTPLHREKVSWFPLCSTWKAKASLPSWSEPHERFFDKTEEKWKDLEHNQPLSASRWGALITQASSVRRADRFIVEQSTSFWDAFRRSRGSSGSR
ncbi:hypothetical protein CVT24_002290 [Panaeolus cyanescens]|uniref:Uncharacterized protein n=1 Tax=Panaeolus cyanescens TaxID=181874 RepID=A0A409WV98_9AGAR|nr:hypothetical protein CVT24_002290 [Panaeolus cyanescens]